MNQITEGFLDFVMEFCEAAGIKRRKTTPITDRRQKEAPRPAATDGGGNGK